MSEWLALLDINSVVIGVFSGLFVGLIIAVFAARSAGRRAALVETERFQPVNNALEDELVVREEELAAREEELAEVQRSLAVAETRFDEQKQHHQKRNDHPAPRRRAPPARGTRCNHRVPGPKPESRSPGGGHRCRAGFRPRWCRGRPSR